MAKRTTLSGFYDSVKASLLENEDPTSLSWERVQKIAQMNDMLVPFSVRHTKRGKGANAVFNIVPEDTAVASTDAAKQYFIKVTAQEVATGKFHSAKNDPVAQTLLKRIGNSLNSSVSDKTKQADRDPNELFRILENLTKVVLLGARNALVVYGGPGTGKTHTVTNTIFEEGLDKDEDWIHVKGKITNASLYKTLYMNRENKLIVFDDCDSVWNDQEAANILKAALDTYAERIISWQSGRTVPVSRMTKETKANFIASVDRQIALDPEEMVKLPSEFEFKSTIIFISNLPKEKMDSAVLTRCAKIDMTLTPEQTFKRIETVAEKIATDVDLDKKLEIIEVLKSKFAAGDLADPSVRTFVAAVDLFKSGIDGWEELIDYI